MAIKQFLKGIGSVLGDTLVTDLQDKVDTTLEEAKAKVEATTEQVIKKLISVFILIFGLIFGLIGLGMFLTAKVPILSDGVGYILVGLVLLLLGWFARYMSK